jgi:hypothetical protein
VTSGEVHSAGRDYKEESTMKNIFFTIVQFVLFFVAFAVGSFMTPFKIAHIISFSPRGTRVFYWDGILLMLILLVIILLIEALRKRLRTAAPWTIAALILATGAGFAVKLGFLTTGTW